MEQNKSHYNKSLKSFSRELRNDSTLAEVILWSKVLKSKGTGYQFNRQYAMNIDDLNIIVDFICRKLKLIIEIDGASHNQKGSEDFRRDKKLADNGYEVLRFSEKEVRYDIDNVVKVIEDTIFCLEDKNN